MKICQSNLFNFLAVSFLFLFVYCNSNTDVQGNVDNSTNSNATNLSNEAVDYGDGYNLTINFANVKNDSVFLGHHFGDKQYVIDTALVNEAGQVNFKSADSDVLGGLYMVILPNKKYFEFILNERSFTINADSTDFLNKTTFKGSKENDIFYEDLIFLNDKKKLAGELNEQKKSLDAESEAAKKITEQLKAVDKEVKSFRKDLQKKNPTLFYTKLLQASPDPEIPEELKNKTDKEGKQAQFDYYKAHYLDGVDFSDERMLNTPLLRQKMTYYFDKLTVQHPDSIFAAASYIIDEKVKGNQDVFKYVTNYVTSNYEKSKIMGMDRVFVYMVEKYYMTGQAYWIDDTQLYKIKDRAMKLKPLLIGEKAPNMILKDRDGKVHNMYDIDKDVTILYFWDPDCGHCKKKTPILKDFWKKYKNESMMIYAACTEVEKDKWLNYVDEQNLDFLNVADFEFRSPFREVYDIYSTPVVYFLDKDKIIKAKKIGVEQLEQVYKDYKAGKIK